MAEEIAFENGRISNFEGLVTFTLTLDRVILHTAVHYSSTSTYKPNFIEIEKTSCGRTDVRTYGRTFETGFIRSTLSKVDLIKIEVFRFASTRMPSPPLQPAVTLTS